MQTPKLRLSGADVVQRLEHLGFTLARAAYGMTLLKRVDRRVMVPDVETIEPEMMEAILRSAGLTEAEFFGRSRSGVYPRQRGTTSTGTEPGVRRPGDGEP